MFTPAQDKIDTKDREIDSYLVNNQQHHAVVAFVTFEEEEGSLTFLIGKLSFSTTYTVHFQAPFALWSSIRTPRFTGCFNQSGNGKATLPRNC